MATLLLRLAGPMQSWGTTSRFDERDTGKEPSKSGVIGLIAAAMGIKRDDPWDKLKPLADLKMGVRYDRQGVLKRDYQTAGCNEPKSIIKADGTKSDDGVPSDRFYLADAAFLVGMEGKDISLIQLAHEKLKNPVWTIALGRKSYLPSEPVYLPDGFKENESLREALTSYPWLGRGNLPESLLYSFESPEDSGRLVMDQPLSSYSERIFGSRFVQSEWIKTEKEVINVSAKNIS